MLKPRADRDVLRVLDAIIRGGRFVNGGLERVARGDSLASHRHDLLFCSSDAVLVGALSRFIADTLHQGNTVIVAVTQTHDEASNAVCRLRTWISPLIRQGRYSVNIGELLARVMVNGWPDRTRFLNATEDLVTEAARRATVGTRQSRRLVNARPPSGPTAPSAAHSARTDVG